MTQTQEQHSTAPDRSGRGLVRLLPSRVDGRVRALAVASLVSQTVIVVTGGAVRLTKSGLGCPTWPKCTAESLVTTPEMGLHGVIEFGNRLLTFVLAIIAVAMIAAVWRFRKERGDLFALSVALFLGIPAQGVVGGITVLTNLNPWVVGLHFILSSALIVLATFLVHRVWRGRQRPRPLGSTERALVWAVAAFAALSVVIGVMVTGSGPHAGDADAPRNGLDPESIARAHVVPVYLLIAATIAALALTRKYPALLTARRPLILLALVILVQGAIGYAQYFTGLPVLLVALHMLGACLLTAAAAHVFGTVVWEGREAANK